MNIFKQTTRVSKIRWFILLLSFLSLPSFAEQDLISLFPLNKYDQTISTWIKPTSPDFDKPLLSADMQQKRMEIFYNHYVGSSSPWSADYVNQVLKQKAPDDLKTSIQEVINQFNNKGKAIDKIGYGLNFRPYDQEWIEKISENINLSQFNNLIYQETQRGIAVDNLSLRALPTDDNYFLSYKIAGEGYPFDYLQMTAVWAGTPVYILGKSRDQAWLFVITPEVMGWVKSKGIARVDQTFADAWINASKRQLIAITRTATSLIDENGQFLLSAYVGSVFPGKLMGNDFRLMFPVSDENHQAKLKWVSVSKATAAVMPLSMTPHHFSNLLSTLIGRAYGWGGMNFYNDCSAELKSLYTPFGIWLPRNSANQVKAGKTIDLDKESPEKRLAYLIQNGKPFLTMVYIKGHIFLYIGNYPNPNNANQVMAMTYQNMWGLKPNPPNSRSIIGKSVLFPLLLKYPEAPQLKSEAAHEYFQLINLNELPIENSTSAKKPIDIKALIYPDNFAFLVASLG